MGSILLGVETIQAGATNAVVTADFTGFVASSPADHTTVRDGYEKIPSVFSHKSRLSAGFLRRNGLETSAEWRV
jgi:hypothetical protein